MKFIVKIKFLLLFFYISSFSQLKVIKVLSFPKAIIQTAVSNDNKYLAVLHAGKEINVYNLEDFSLVNVLSDKGEGDIAITFSPDNNYLLAGGWDKILKLWDFNTKRIVNRYYGHLQAPRNVAFHPNGKIIASAGWDNIIRMWFTPTAINIKNLEGHTQCIRAIAFSPDGRYIASGGYDQHLKLWDLGKNKEVFSVKTSAFPIETIAYSPKGDVIATAGLENNIKLWDARNGNLIAVLKGHTDAIYSIAFSPDGEFLASGGNDNYVRIWNLKTKTCINKFIAHSQGIRSIVFTSNCKYLITGAVDKLVKIWDLSPLNLKPKYFLTSNTDVLYNFPEIKVVTPTSINHLSTKRILPLTFEINKPEYSLVQLFLNKFEYTRFYNNEKQVVKPLSVRYKSQTQIEVNYEIYLDYDKNIIQFIAVNPNTQDIITTPEIKVTYFDIENFKERATMYILYIDGNNFKEKKWKKEFIKDNADEMFNVLKSQKNKLFNNVVCYNLNEMHQVSDIYSLFDTLIAKTKYYDVLLLYFNTYFFEKNNKINIVLNKTDIKNIDNTTLSLDSVINLLIKTKAYAALFLNFSQNTTHIPKGYTIKESTYLDNEIVESINVNKNISYISFKTDKSDQIGNIFKQSLSGQNDFDYNNLIDFNEFANAVQKQQKINFFTRGLYIPLVKK
ncbi:MAG: WD40 repeat domain-containing protein [Bacteroidales bacterium]|nr:WD40 repeat domain-containing protein [Bacteroidales bacterium]